VKIMRARSRRHNREISDDDCRSCGLSFAISAILFIVELVYILMGNLVVIYLTSLIFLPQIIQNCGKRAPFKMMKFWYIFVMGTSKFGFILYIKLFRENLFRLSPDISFAVIYGIILYGQVLVLYIQTKAPQLCLQCYFQRVPMKEIASDEMCPICYEDMRTSPKIKTGTNTEPLRPKKIIQTTCHHSFHEECLKEWLKEKGLCPLCRTNIEEDIDELISEGVSISVT